MTTTTTNNSLHTLIDNFLDYDSHFYMIVWGYTNDIPDKCGNTYPIFVQTQTPEQESTCAKLVCRTCANIGNFPLNLSD